MARTRRTEISLRRMSGPTSQDSALFRDRQIALELDRLEARRELAWLAERFRLGDVRGLVAL